jgi:hypothetical protein
MYSFVRQLEWREKEYFSGSGTVIAAKVVVR